MHTIHTTQMSFGAAVATSDVHRLAIHRYVIRVSQSDPAPSEAQDIKVALLGIVAQLNGRQLEVMLLGSAPTPAGIAAWAIEQLALNFPRLSSVCVTEDEIDAVTIEREVTRL